MTDKRNDRLEQLRRQWRSYGKYRVPADPAGAELHETVTELLDLVEELEDAETDCGHEPWELDRVEDLEGEINELHEDIRRLQDGFDNELAEKLVEFAPVVEELHRQAHGAGSLYLCPVEPCRGLYRLLPNERGRVLA